MNSSLGSALILASVAVAAFGGVVGIVAGLTRREAMFPWVRWAAVAFFATMLLANLTMVNALLTHDFSVSYVAQVGSKATPTIFTIVSLWSALEGSILFWGLILGAYVVAFALVHRKEPGRFVTLATGTMLAVSVFFAFLIAGPANPFTPTAQHVLEQIRAAGDGPGPNPLLQNHVLMIVHPPMLYLGYVGMTIPFGIAIAGLLAGEMGPSWMGPLRRWTLIPWLFLSIGIILGAWWAYAVLGWGGYWAWDPVENASLLPWLTATAFLHSTMVHERRNMLKVWTIVLALLSFWLTILGTFMTRSGVFNSVHSFTQSDIGPTFLAFLGVVALVSIVLTGARGHLLTDAGSFKSYASREFAILVNNVVFGLITFIVILGTTYPLILEAVSEKRISVGEPFFDTWAVPLGLVVLLLMGVGPSLPWGSSDPKAARRLIAPTIAAVVVLAVRLVFGNLGIQSGYTGLGQGASIWGNYKDHLATLTFALAAFVTVITLREMFLPAWVRVREKNENVVVAVWESATRSRRRFGGYLVHLGIIVIICAVAASRAYTTHQSGTLSEGQTMTMGPYAIQFAGLAQGKEPHREWVGARLNVTTSGGSTETLIPRMNFYEMSTDPVGTPAVRSIAREDLYISLMAFDERARTASLKVWVFPLVGWIWWSIPILVLGTLIAMWPARKARAVLASSPLASASGGSAPGPSPSPGAASTASAPSGTASEGAA